MLGAKGAHVGGRLRLGAVPGILPRPPAAVQEPALPPLALLGRVRGKR